MIRERKLIAALAIVFALGGMPVNGEVVAYFKFDNIKGSLFTDDTGKGLVGTLGLPTNIGEPEIITGPSGADTDKAILMSGDGGMAVDDTALFALEIYYSLTLEGWFKAPEYTVNFDTPFINYVDSYQLGIATDGTLYYNLPGIENINSGVLFPFDDEWHHIAIVDDVDANTLTLYIDGDVAFTRDGSPGLNFGTNLLLIGRNDLTPNAATFQGAMDRLRISAVALSPDELDSDPAAVKEPTDDTLALFTFDEDSLPYPNHGMEPSLSMVTARGYASGNTGAPEVSPDSPSGAEGDFSLYTADGSHALVLDPEGVLDVGGPGNNYTLEAWVKYETGNFTDRMVIFYHGPGAYSFSLGGGDPRVVFITTLRIADFSSTSAFVTPDEWHHVAVVHKDGESLSFFVDGELIEEDTYTGGTRLAEVHQMTIGSEPNGVLPFTGWIDRIRISNEALTADQMDSNAMAPVSVADWSIY
ncbi:MAG: LamG domain-containing protein [Candidatus Omnitrophica bacterium]|nr:LamG domain-containing protein [Candidatus Omnitrophota bacterium]